MLYTSLAQVSLSGTESLQGINIKKGSHILPYLNVAGIALSINLLLRWYQQRKQTLEIVRQKDAVELQLLKAQLNPHFLFSTLNNLYSHTLERSPESPEIVMNLSELLRYMIYESNAQRIPLIKEINSFKSYISLEESRYRDRLDISVSITGDIEKYQIAPFLLLPFLENAFKHGTDKKLDQCWISANISIDNSVMYFKLVNSIEPVFGKEQKKIDCQGLQQVNKRLELLYNDKFSFDMKWLEEALVVNLQISLEELEEQYKEKGIMPPLQTVTALT